MDSTEFWTAVILLAVTVMLTAYSVYQQHVQARRLRTMELAVTDTRGLRRALRKPLEGTWKYTLDYSRFHGSDGAWQATGKAVFLWAPGSTSYDVFIGASVSEENRVGQPIVTFFLEGRLAADAQGWPPRNASIDCSYVARSGRDGFDEPSKPNLNYTKVVVKKSPAGRFAIETTAMFSTGKTEGVVTWRRLE